MKEVGPYRKLALSSLMIDIDDLLVLPMPRFAKIFRGRQTPDTQFKNINGSIIKEW
jgi:hypothetical protein